LERVINFVNNHHHILVSNELLSLNRSISYVTFATKEIYEFLSSKLNDGKFAYYSRRAHIIVKKYNELFNKLSQ